MHYHSETDFTPRDGSAPTPHLAWVDEEACAAETGERHLALVAQR